MRGQLARPGRLAWSILGVALIVRVAYVLGTDWVAFFDPGDYDRHARSMLDGDGYPQSLIAGEEDPTALRMPLYPIFLAAVYAVAGESWEAARLAQALLGTVTVALIGLVALRLFDRRIALIATGAAAVFPPLIVLGGTLMSENLLVPLELAALLAVLEHRRSEHRYRWALAAGALLALATLTRPNALVLGIPLLIGLWTAGPRARTAVVAFLAAAAVVYAPWPVRNAVALDAFVPLSTELGLVATGVYNDYSRHESGEKPGSWQEPWRYAEESKAIWADKSQTEPEMDKNLRSAARRYVQDNPTYPFEAAFWNTTRLFHLTGEYPEWASQLIGVSRRSANLALFGYYAFALLALAGVVAAFGRVRGVPLFVWLIPVVIWASLIFLANEPRSRSPIDPFILLLAALGAAAIWDRLRGGTESREAS